MSFPDRQAHDARIGVGNVVRTRRGRVGVGPAQHVAFQRIDHQPRLRAELASRIVDGILVG